MARIKNVTDDVLTIPSLDVTAQPGEIVEVPDADAFKDSEFWQVTSAKSLSGIQDKDVTLRLKKKTEEN